MQKRVEGECEKGPDRRPQESSGNHVLPAHAATSLYVKGSYARLPVNSPPCSTCTTRYLRTYSANCGANLAKIGCVRRYTGNKSANPIKVLPRTTVLLNEVQGTTFVS